MSTKKTLIFGLSFIAVYIIMYFLLDKFTEISEVVGVILRAFVLGLMYFTFRFFEKG